MALGRSSSLDPARGERGFTLIELLVVIVIIGILSAIAIPRLLDQQTKATDASAQSTARVLETAVASCFLSLGSYAQCATPTALPDDAVTWGTAPGDGNVMSQPFGVAGTLTLGYSASGNVYGILILPDQTSERICQTSTGTYPKGNCVAGGAYSAYGYGTW